GGGIPGRTGLVRGAGVVTRRVVFAVPGDLETPTGGYAYDRRVIAELRAVGWDVAVVGPGDGFPRPRPETPAAARAPLAAAVPADRIIVAVPGVDKAAPAAGSRDGPVELLAVGAIVPRKGYDVLIAALAGLTDLSWRLTIAGDRGRDPPVAAQLEADIARHGL